jgi:NAD(P)-dependent dehydrogenase (short-subunit alcohol dehydrogenase family)
MEYDDLTGKTVFITGANRGIGKGIADKFIKNKCRIIAVYRKNKPNLMPLENDEFKHIFIKSDINDIDYISQWLTNFEKENGKIDILINNAGVNIEESLFDTTLEKWDIIMGTNLKATFFLSQLLAKHMKKNKKGVIINATSFAAQIPSAYYGVYAASKSALVSLTKSMAAEWAPYNIRVNSYSPGVVKTQMTQPAIEKNEKKMLETISLKRFGKVEEVADAVLFLSSEASSYITGVNLDVSGGKFIIQNSYSVL